MKQILILVLSCASFSLLGSEIRVQKMQREEGMERSFLLHTNISEFVVLDCQSFIQGLRIGEQENAHTFLLDPFECENLHKRIKSSLRRLQHHCIDVEDDIRSDRTCY